MRCVPITRAAVALAFLFLAGCGSSAPERLYTLTGDPRLEKTEAPPASPVAYSVAVGPVTVPPVVDRPQFVIQAAPNRVVMLDQERWAEPLKNAIARVIESDLAVLLGARVVRFPQDSLVNVKYRVGIDVQDFTSEPGQAATVSIWWTVYEPDDKVKHGRSLVREPTNGAGYEALAAAHGRALKAVSREVAAAIRDAETSH